VRQRANETFKYRADSPMNDKKSNEKSLKNLSNPLKAGGHCTYGCCATPNALYR
jgi:hypothetical protein